MRKTLKRIVEETTGSSSINNICDNQICNAISPIADFFIFPEYLIFNANTYLSKAISLLIFLGLVVLLGLLIERIFKKVLKDTKYLKTIIAVHEKVMAAAILFYGIKIVFYLIQLRR